MLPYLLTQTILHYYIQSLEAHLLVFQSLIFEVFINEEHKILRLVHVTFQSSRKFSPDRVESVLFVILFPNEELHLCSVPASTKTVTQITICQHQKPCQRWQRPSQQHAKPLFQAAVRENYVSVGQCRPDTRHTLRARASVAGTGVVSGPERG